MPLIGASSTKIFLPAKARRSTRLTARSMESEMSQLLGGGPRRVGPFGVPHPANQTHQASDVHHQNARQCLDVTKTDRPRSLSKLSQCGADYSGTPSAKTSFFRTSGRRRTATTPLTPKRLHADSFSRRSRDPQRPKTNTPLQASDVAFCDRRASFRALWKLGVWRGRSDRSRPLLLARACGHTVVAPETLRRPCHTL